jgi:glycosyltransferase involved in cell wall biosynthesis
METFAVAAFPQLLRRRYDVVHCMTPTAAVASRLAGQRTIYTVLIHPTHRQYERNPIERRLTAAGVRAAHAVTALSEASADATRDVFGRPAEVLAPGVRLDRFPPELAPRTGPPRLLFPADASDQRKSLHVALGALARIAGDHPGIRLQLAGPGDPEWALRFVKDDRATVEPLLEVLGTGELDDVPRRYREATVTVLPSHSEAFGLVLVESLASGTPAVCSRSGGMPEIVDDPGVGRAVEPGDPEALARALTESIGLASEPGTAKRCTEHARRWGWRESIGPSHEALYERVMRRRGPR